MRISKLPILFTLVISLVLGAVFPVSAPALCEEETEDPLSPEPVYGGLFDTGTVHTVSVVMEEEDWDDLLLHPADKTKYTANVTIDGELVPSVSFSAKGNSSLIFVRDLLHSDRFSYKINFGKNIKGQTYHGLDKLNLQNLFADPTYMKEHLSYELFRSMGVEAPLSSYVRLSVNGIDRGLYLAVEDVDSGYLDRVREGKGALYKPESESVALDPDSAESPMQDRIPVDTSGAHGADLVYRDDQPESYPDIFSDTVTKKDSASFTRVIAALKGLRDRRNLERYLNTDEIIRYFAVHNYLVNFDSYTGPMLHNYFLYEHAGRLELIPWDYNLAFGTFPSDPGSHLNNDAGLIINQGIDTPFASTGVKEQDRPMWAWIPEDAYYLSWYHTAMDQLLREHLQQDILEERIGKLSEMLLPYVESDPTAFFTAEEYRTAVTALLTFFRLRTESIRLQLDGKLSPCTELQSPSDRVDAGELSLFALGEIPTSSLSPSEAP